MSQEPLQGARVLLMEDEILVAMDLQGLLESWGCEVVGPFATVSAGIEVAGSATLDAALLDVNLLDGVVTPIAERLRARGLPAVLHTACGEGALPASLTSFARVTKPSTESELAAALRTALSEASRAA